MHAAEFNFWVEPLAQRWPRKIGQSDKWIDRGLSQR